MSQIVLIRLSQPCWNYGSALSENRHCRLDPCSSQHGASVDQDGVLHYFHISVASNTTTELLSFQLQLQTSADAQFEPIRQPWTFEFIPGLPGEIMLVQANSCRILYASLPRQGSSASDVFLFGSHTARITCISTNGNVALSGCCQGMLKLWRMADGQLSDSVVDPAGEAVTAIQHIGPLTVAAGTAAGTVTLYDLASGRLLAVQRLLAGQGPVSCLATWLHPQLLSSTNSATPGPRAPDGGGVLGCNRDLELSSGHKDGPPGAEMTTSSVALLAVAGEFGWLRVYQASAVTPSGWHSLHDSSTGSMAGPVIAIAFSPGGDTLAVATPAAQYTSTDAVAVAAAGGHPGAVSLYNINCNTSSSGCSCAEEVPSSVSAQQLRLWHQWCLRSMPVSLDVLPNSGVQLLTDGQLDPVQVLHLLLTVEHGGSLVLTASRSLERNSQQRPHQQTVQGSAAGASPSRLVEQDSVLQQQQHHAGSSRAIHQPSLSPTAEAAEADVLNLAERDLADVADAIADAGEWQESDVEKLLESLVAEATAALESQVTGDHAAAAAASAAESAGVEEDAHLHQAFAAVDDTAGCAAAEGQQQQEQHNADCAVKGAQRCLFGGSSSARTNLQPVEATAAFVTANFLSSATAVDSSSSNMLQQQQLQNGCEGEAAAAAWVRRPSTLPTLRSWMDRAAALAAGIATEGPAGPVDLAALAEEMQQQQEQQGASAQQCDGEVALSAASEASPAAEQSDAVLINFPEQQQQQTEDELELPCESSFQELLQDIQPEQQGGQQQQLACGTETEAAEEDNTSAYTSAAGLCVQRAEQQQQCSRQEAGATLPHPSVVAGAVAAAFSDAAAEEDCEPQPRQLPVAIQRAQLSKGQAGHMVDKQQPWMLQQQHAVQANAAEQLNILHTSSAAPGPAKSGTHRSIPKAAAAAAWAPAAVCVTPAISSVQHGTVPVQHTQRDARGLNQQVSASMPAETTQNQCLQKQQQKPLSVRERLSLRRAQAQQQQQQQQQLGKENHPTAAAFAQAGVAAEAVLVPAASDHPLATASVNSSHLLQRKIKEAEEAPDVTVNPSAPDVIKLAAKLSDLDVSLDEQLYQDLQDLKDIPTPRHAQKLVPKQLDARWVASRNLKPQMDTLFKPEEWQPGSVQPQVLVLPSWPTPQQVVQQLLWPQRSN